MQTPATVLLVEDDDGDAFLVRELLSDVAPSMKIVRATTLGQARAELASWVPDVVLLDLGLPDADGSTVVADMCEAATGSAVLVLTGLGDEHRGAAAVAVGAQDFLVKGQVSGASLERSMRYAVERKQVDAIQRERLTAQVRAAENARLERGLLPQPHVRDRRVRLANRYRPGRHQSLIGGDFYDVVETPDGRLHVVVGDVAGHGADAAALGVLLRGAWRAVVLSGAEPSGVMPLLSQMLCLERQSDEIFATALYVVIDPDRCRVRLFNAGHPRPLSLAGEVSAPWPDQHGPVLGIPALAGWEPIDIDITGRWPLMLYTDGLIEGFHLDARLGEDGLRAFLGAEMAIDPDITTLADRVIARVEETNAGPLPDDVAVLLIDMLGDQQAAR